MGHLIGGGFLTATTKEAAMKEAHAAACEYAYYNGDRGEGSDEYTGRLVYYDRIFDTEEEAWDFFESLGSYEDGVCMVREASKGATNRYNKKVASIRTKREAYVNKVIERFKERTSKSVGCKKCGTRVNSEDALRRNLICPTCRSFLIPTAAQERLDKFDEQIRLAEVQYKKDQAETGKPRYFCKYEIHT